MGRRLDPTWSALLARHADRFVLGTDAFYLSEQVPGRAPAALFAAHTVPRLGASERLLDLLPDAVAEAVGEGNAARIYGVR